MSKAVTLEEFLSRARKHHGDKYDYSQVRFSKIKDKVNIICPDHGLFSQNAQHHSNGIGCKQCGFRRVSESKSMTPDEFMMRARAAHGERFTYTFSDNFMFTGSVGITCPEHGYFERTVKYHLQGDGCAICSGRRLGNELRLTQEAFISSAISKHGKRYDYSQTVVNGRSGKVTIGCRLHGEFSQSAGVHLGGSGCKQCAIITAARTKKRNDSIVGYSRGKYISAAERNTGGKGNLYVVRMQAGDESFIKVGISIYGAANRFSRLTHYSIGDMMEITMPAGDAWDAEKRLHKALKPKAYHPRERFGGYTECFSELNDAARRIIGELNGCNVKSSAQGLLDNQGA